MIQILTLAFSLLVGALSFYLGASFLRKISQTNDPIEKRSFCFFSSLILSQGIWTSIGLCLFTFQPLSGSYFYDGSFLFLAFILLFFSTFISKYFIFIRPEPISFRTTLILSIGLYVSFICFLESLQLFPSVRYNIIDVVLTLIPTFGFTFLHIILLKQLRLGRYSNKHWQFSFTSSFLIISCFYFLFFRVDHTLSASIPSSTAFTFQEFFILLSWMTAFQFFSFAFYLLYNTKTEQQRISFLQNLEQKNKELSNQIITDSATGLQNSLALNEYLSVEQETQSFIYFRIINAQLIEDSLGPNLFSDFQLSYSHFLSTTFTKLLNAQTFSTGILEFAVTTNSLDQKDLLNAFSILNSKPYQFQNNSFYVLHEAGVSQYPIGDFTYSTGLIKAKQSLLYKSNKSDSDFVHFYNSSIQSKSSQTLQLTNDLKRAFLEDFGLYLVFQPKKLTPLNDHFESEVLIRWKHPTIGFLSPLDFLGIAQSMGLNRDLDKWVIQRTISHISNLLIEFPKTKFRVSINVSPSFFLSTEILPFIQTSCHLSNIPIQFVSLEITEGTMLYSPTIAAQQIQLFSNIGVQVNIDDFGVGYSSLSYLRDLACHTIKIDRAFIKDLPSSQKDLSIVQSVIQLSKSLGFHVIAEGVETKDQEDLLFSLGIDGYQGYFFAKPMNFNDYVLFIKTDLLQDQNIDIT